MKLQSLEKKIVPPENLGKLITELKSQGKTIITTNGCFDILHLGHIKYLHEAKQLGDILIVGINSDASVKKLKGPKRPINSEQVRALQLSGLESVNYVTIFEENTPEKLLAVLKPNFHVKGGDYSPGQLPEKTVVESNGGKVICLSMIKGFSTTELLKKMMN